MSRRDLSRPALFALFAIWFAALAPTISYVLAAGQGQSVVEMCTSFGLQKVVAQDQGEKDPGSSNQAADRHCPFCLTPQAVALFQPTQPLLLSAATVIGAVAPVPRSAHFDPNLAWLVSHAHAPPVLS